MYYFCCNDRRRDVVKQLHKVNGIDYLEVFDDPKLPGAQRQRKLYVHFINELGVAGLTEKNMRIEGGERITNIVPGKPVVGIDDTGTPGNVLTVPVNTPGDFSIYTLRLVVDASQQHSPLPPDFDQLLAAVDFSFKVNCSNDFDCKDEHFCPPERLLEPEIDYLAKDYASFRQLILDRMSVLLPLWKERNPADQEMVLVELLSYIGDYLSYQQDAIATEAYLGTARRRTSIRRHARLVDCFIHDGSNARAWVQVKIKADSVRTAQGPAPVPRGTQLLTHIDGQPSHIADAALLRYQTMATPPETFETLDDLNELYVSHNSIAFYTWGAHDCCLPKGATRATLLGYLQDADHIPPEGTFPVLHLKEGDILIFEEVLGPRTGVAGDADPTHRHAVRLTNVVYDIDQIGGRFKTPPDNNPVYVTQIEWAAEDALPFPLCISGTLLVNDTRVPTENIGVALGNIVLADHGQWVYDEPLGTVPLAMLTQVGASTGDRCSEQAALPIPPRFNPHLAQKPLTFALPYTPDTAPASASAVMTWIPEKALPVLQLASNPGTLSWGAQRDLLGSDEGARDFVVEVENDGTAYLRFGDGRHGVRPEPATAYSVSYRVGNGARGNVGADRIQHIISANDAIDSVTNPLPACGGVEPESIEDVRQKAPNAFRTQRRAVTPGDYESVVERDPTIQRAAATFRWTGSWYTVFLTVDPKGGTVASREKQNFRDYILKHVEPFRMAGYDLEVDAPIAVSLEIEMHVCVKPNYFRSNVQAALLKVFSNRMLPDGRLGVFHPDNFSFGQPVYLSPLYAAALSVEGVESVTITTFQRQGMPDDRAREAGKLVLGRLEISRLDNDPNFPERGVFRLHMDGGK